MARNGSHEILNFLLKQPGIDFNEQEFIRCEKLIQISIPSSIKEIKKGTFSECTALKEVIFEKNSSPTLFGEYSFMNCLSLTEITIPSSVINIEKSAFENCKSLNHIKFEDPTKLKNVGMFAFKGCHYIQNDINELQKICGNYYSHCFEIQMLKSSKFFLPAIKKINFENPASVKLTVIGSLSVGKSCLSRCFCGLEFVKTNITIGADFYQKQVMINGIMNDFYIWDASGNEVYHGIIPVFLINANLIMIVFDITNPKSFYSLDYFLKKVHENSPSHLLHTILVGNKCDMERKVSKEEIEQYALSKKLHYFEVSALTKQGFEELIAYSTALARLSYFFDFY